MATAAMVATFESRLPPARRPEVRHRNCKRRIPPLKVWKNNCSPKQNVDRFLRAPLTDLSSQVLDVQLRPAHLQRAWCQHIVVQDLLELEVALWSLKDMEAMGQLSGRQAG